MTINVKTSTKKWRRGMFRTPPVPCPICGRKTRAINVNTCQWCHSEWKNEQLRERDRLRNEMVEEFRKQGLLD